MKQPLIPILSVMLSTVALSAAEKSSTKPSDQQSASSFKQGEMLPSGQYPAAYNAPAQVKLQNGEDKWWPDVFVDASFIYYLANEDGLDIGTSAALETSTGSANVGATSNGQIALQDFKYSPGFKVGLGTRFSEWTLSGEYTWIRQTTNTSQTPPNPNFAGLSGATGVWMINDWFLQTAPTTNQAMSATSFKSAWHLAVDLGDLMLSRAFYQGRRVRITPSFGLRGAWIRQNLDIGIDIPSAVIADPVFPETFSFNSSRSWAVGPRAAMEVDCLLGMGFRLQGEVGASLLFTQYTQILHSEDVASPTALPTLLQAQYHDYNCVRPVGELGMGLGWGSYLGGEQYYLDFAATYDFILFWNQNMMRKLLDASRGIGGASGGDLSLNGLTFKASLDF